MYLIHIAFLALTLTVVNTAYGKALTQKEVVDICQHYSSKPEMVGFLGDCDLVAAIAWVETRYRPDRFNPEKTGSYGLMQIQCSTAKMVGLKYGCEQLYDPKINIRFGMKYLIWIGENKDTLWLDDAIAAWNAGTPIKCTKVNKDKKGKLLCYPGEYINHDYVSNVLRRYEYIRSQYDMDSNYVLNSIRGHSRHNKVHQ